MTNAPSGVEVWFVDVARAGPALAALEDALPRLSADELERAAALGRNGGEWRLFRIALRLLLERIVGPRLRRVPFQTAPQGKPLMPWDAGVAFSLSHAGPYGLIAITDREVGVDIEQDRPVQFPAHWQKAMLAAARALAAVSASSGPSQEILQAWVRLEAWGKARGSGIGVLLHDLGIRGPGWIDRRRDLDFGRIAADLARQEGFTLHDLALPRPLYAALATRTGFTPLPIRPLPSDLTDLQALGNSSPQPTPSNPHVDL